MHASADVTGNADDVAAIKRFREALLAQNWPDSETVRSIVGRSSDTGVDSKFSCIGTSENIQMFGVWAGYEYGGYRYPPFQFLKGSLVNPRLSELMEALARQPGLHPSYDKSGWERAFWLYQPRGRLSIQSLALRAAKFKDVLEDPQSFADLPNEARTPAEVFSGDHQAVIDLANEDADQQTRGNRD